MQITINEKQQELKDHGSFEFPVFISQEILSRYERGSFSWHWHPEIELTLVMENQICYQVNDQVYHLKAGDGLFCNTNALHTGHMIDGQDCYYISTTFHPRMIYGFEGSVLQRDFVNPVISNASLGSIVFHPDIPWQKEILDGMVQIYQLSLTHPVTFEMQVQQLLSFIWLSICRQEDSLRGASSGANGLGRDMERLRVIITFIQEHYHEKISLADIASQINICKSECCRFFKKNMGTSLFDYLLYYRIEKSLPLLTEGRLSVTEIAEATGFSTSGYFARVFRDQMHCSPSLYRSQKRS